MGLAGVVLAAGASERMGRTKALLDFRGRPFADRILEAREALDLKSRVVVLGPDAARVRPSLATHECVIVENADVAGEAIGSLRAALAALEPIRPSGILAWPVDLPHVRVATLERLLEAHRRTGAPAVVPSFADERRRDPRRRGGGARRPRAGPRHGGGGRPGGDRRSQYAGGL